MATILPGALENRVLTTAGSLARKMAGVSLERTSDFFRWDKHAFPSYRNNIVYFNILQTGYRYRQSYRRKRASRLVVSNLEIRRDRYATGTTGRSLKLVSSKNIREFSKTISISLRST